MISDLALLTPDPADIDIDALHRLMSQDRSYGIASAAEDFEADFDVIRLAIDEHPVPVPTSAAHMTANPTGGELATLTPDGLRDLYHARGLTIGEIAAQSGAPPSMVRQIAHENGIRLRPASRTIRDPMAPPGFITNTSTAEGH
jgi:hypothetical protein